MQAVDLISRLSDRLGFDTRTGANLAFSCGLNELINKPLTPFRYKVDAIWAEGCGQIRKVKKTKKVRKRMETLSHLGFD